MKDCIESRGHVSIPELKRMRFSEISEEAIKEGLAKAALARNIIDYLMGNNLSAALSGASSSKSEKGVMGYS